MPVALFLLGHAGSGKTKMAKRWVKARLRKGEPWVLLDKDICGQGLANALMVALGLDPNDRDSPEYKAHVRDLEYQGCLDLAKDQLRLGINVVMPGPWNKEIVSGRLFDAVALGFPPETELRHIYLDVPVGRIKNRIIERESVRDAWKLAHWDEFEKTLDIPDAVVSRSVARMDPAAWDSEGQIAFIRGIVKVGPP